MGFGCFNVLWGLAFHDLRGLGASLDYEVGCFNVLWGLVVSMDYGDWVFQWTMGFKCFNGLWA